MNKQTARALLMDFLYSEISTEDEKKLKVYLENHPELFEELKELRKAQKLLGEMPGVESPQRLRMVVPRRRTFGMWWEDVKTVFPHSGWGKAAFAAAACLLFLLIAGSIANLQIASSKSGFSLSLGYANEIERSATEQPEGQKPVAKQEKNVASTTSNKNLATAKEAQKFLTTDEAEILLTKMQQQNEVLLTAFAKKMNQQDQQQLQKIIKFFQAQRMYDLKRIKQNLNQTQLVNAYRWQQTNQMLGKIVQTASVKN